jgi:hypothetical protein
LCKSLRDIEYVEVLSHLASFSLISLPEIVEDITIENDKNLSGAIILMRLHFLLEFITDFNAYRKEPKS